MNNEFINVFKQKFYVLTSRQLRRLESVSRSPIYSHFSETLSGVATIRAYDVSKQFIHESDERVDQNQRCFYPNVASNRWLSVRLELIANFIILFSAFFAVYYRHNLEPGTVGLFVSYAMNVTQDLSWLVRSSADIETNIVGVERILEYCDLSTEAEWHNKTVSVPQNWPTNGNICFAHYSTKYREGLELVLKDIYLTIRSGEKVLLNTICLSFA